MQNNLLLYAGILLFGVFISSISQVMLKKAAEQKYSPWWKEYFNPVVIAAYAIFFGATFCTIFAYKVVPLSMGPIMEATSYIYVTLFGVTIFHEKLNQKRVTALVMIICGIIIFTISS